jgi:hypothetical protein
LRCLGFDVRQRAARSQALIRRVRVTSPYESLHICPQGPSARDPDWLQPKRGALCAGPYAHDSSLSATTLFLCPMHTGTLALVLLLAAMETVEAMQAVAAMEAVAMREAMEAMQAVEAMEAV